MNVERGASGIACGVHEQDEHHMRTQSRSREHREHQRDHREHHHGDGKHVANKKTMLQAENGEVSRKCWKNRRVPNQLDVMVKLAGRKQRASCAGHWQDRKSSGGAVIKVASIEVGERQDARCARLDRGVKRAGSASKP